MSFKKTTFRLFALMLLKWNFSIGVCQYMNKSDLSRNLFMLKGALAKNGYDWWWHSFTGYKRETGEEKSFFIEYFIINPELGGEEPIFGQLLENKIKDIKPSYVMIKAGCWGKNAKQIHQFYSIKELERLEEVLDLKVGKCTLTEKRLIGEIKLTDKEQEEHPEYMSDAGHMIWDLKVDKKIAFNVGYGASKLFRKLNCFEMFWHAEGMCSEFEGTVTLDGEVYDIVKEKSYGYCDKNWGKNFTSPWVWISSCNMVSKITNKPLKNSVIDVGGGRPKILGIPLDRKLLIGMYYEGEMYEYNFSKLWNGAKIKFDVKEEETRICWKIKAQNRKSYMELETYCNKEDMLHINYEAPDGKKLHNRLWNGGNGFGELKLYKLQGGNKVLIDHIEMKNIGCEYGEYSEET
jgi:hypothetical protein